MTVTPATEGFFNGPNHEATLLLVELAFGWVSDSAALVEALAEQSAAAAV
jgi:hypothetical protein